MYLSMTTEDYNKVIEEARGIVAKRLGVLPDQVKDHDRIAADLLGKYIEVYTEWWQASCEAKQGDPHWKESVKVIQDLIDKRGHMRLALMSYLNAQYPSKRTVS